MNELESTGERLVTSTTATYGVIEHLHRYALAAKLAENKIALDIASGEGYGSFIVSKSAKYVYGVDIDDRCVSHANEKYSAKDNLKYLNGSTSKIPLPDKSVDVVISFETLEHHSEHELMMQEIVRVLKEDGCLLLSSPEKSIYKQRDPNNPFHIKELLFEELDRLLKKYFKYNNYLTQRFVIGSLIHSHNANRQSHFAMYNGDYSDITEGLPEFQFYNKPFFNLAICSNVVNQNDRIPLNSFFNGVEVVRKEIENLKAINDRTINSTTYKLSRWMIKRIGFIKKLR